LGKKQEGSFNLAKPRVFITRRISPVGLDLILTNYQADIWKNDLPIPREDLLQHIKGIAGLLSMLSDRIDGAVMDAAGSGLKVISTYSVGVDNIDLAEATRRGISVGHTPDVLTDATADFAFALLMAAARRVAEADRYVRAGHWRTWGPSTLLGAEVHGATLGIVGFGRIGQAVARRASGFAMRVLFNNHQAENKTIPADLHVESVDLDTLLREADFVSLHVPLTDQTRQLFDSHLFAKMKPGAILINTARGAIVDQAALYEALSSGKLAAAGIDVCDPEPLPMDSPLLTLENLVIAPHIASAGKQTRERMAVMAAENLLAGLRGEKLPHCANPQVYQQG
jgi:glyoxylate reductase